jgi:hypothetical protein
VGRFASRREGNADSQPVWADCIANTCIIIIIVVIIDRLCGLVVRVLGYPEARVRFPALPEKKSSGSGTGSTQPREYN